jgi:hypothetical protein
VKCCLLMAAVLLTSSAHGQTSALKPPIPPGPPTRLQAVALLSSGIDYTRPGIAAKLARDGEGEIIGWDAIDGDRKPFLRDGPATRLVAMAPTLVAPFRLDLTSADSWERAVSTLARTPARVAVVAVPPSKTASRGRWDALFAAMPQILFIIPADDGQSDPTIAANVIVVATLPVAAKSGADLILAAAAATREAPLSSDLPNTAEEAAILLPGVFACTDLRSAKSPADVKTALIAKAAKGTLGSPPLLGLCR